VNLNRINLFPFGVIDANDTKATYYFIGIVNITTCGNPFVVMNLRHCGTNRYPTGHATLVKSTESREKMHRQEKAISMYF